MCVLVVEDDALVREVLAEHLANAGLPILLAADGDEAAGLICDPPRRISVLITDFNMPGSRHGCDVADLMKATHPHVHIFIMTGRPDLVSAACPEGVAYTVLPKPHGLWNLADRLEGLVEH